MSKYRAESEAKAKAPSKDAKDAPDTPGPSAADSSKPAVSDLHAKLLKTLDSATLLPEETIEDTASTADAARVGNVRIWGPAASRPVVLD